MITVIEGGESERHSPAPGSSATSSDVGCS